jgi:hypothetical protein
MVAALGRHLMMRPQIVVGVESSSTRVAEMSSNKVYPQTERGGDGRLKSDLARVRTVRNKLPLMDFPGGDRPHPTDLEPGIEEDTSWHFSEPGKACRIPFSPSFGSQITWMPVRYCTVASRWVPSVNIGRFRVPLLDAGGECTSKYSILYRWHQSSLSSTCRTASCVGIPIVSSRSYLNHLAQAKNECQCSSSETRLEIVHVLHTMPVPTRLRKMQKT